MYTHEPPSARRWDLTFVPLLVRVVQQLGRRDGLGRDQGRGVGRAREERSAAHRAVAAAVLRGCHGDADLERRRVAFGDSAEPRDVAGALETFDGHNLARHQQDLLRNTKDPRVRLALEALDAAGRA